MQFKNNRIISLLTLGAAAVVCPPGSSTAANNGSLRSRNLQVVALSNCANDCMTMPLIMGFDGKCDTACQVGVLKKAGVPKGTYRHLTGVNMVFIDELADAQLFSLQAETINVSFLECDSCIAASTQSPICGSNDQTYMNVDSFNCGQKCRGADTSVSVAYQGECKANSAVLSVDEVPLQNCPKDGSYNYPLMIGLDDRCDSSCATQTMQSTGISSVKYDHLTSVNIMVLNEASDDEVATLRADPKNIKYIECDSPVSTTQVDLTNCPADGSLNMPLLISFTGSCGSSCANQAMQNADIEESKFDFLSNTNIIVLNSVTDEELEALRSDSKNVATIECDSPVSTTQVDLTNCPDDGSLNMPLLISFTGSCGSSCANQAMQNADIEESEFDYLSNTNIIVLNSVTDKELEALRSDSKNVATIECDTPVEALVELSNCPDDGSLILPVMVGFNDNCDNDCVIQTLKRANIDKTEYEQLTHTGIVVLNTVTDDQLTALRTETENINLIECDGTVQNQDDLISLSSCADDCMRMPLMITFQENCDNDCAQATMVEAGIEDHEHLTETNIIMVNEITDNQLVALRGKDKNIVSIECDDCVTSDNTFGIGIFQPVCSSNNVTYDSEDLFNCDLKCRGADKSSTIAYQGECGTQIIDPIVLGNCNDNCMTMPLIITFSSDCDTTCASQTMKAAQIDKSSYQHLANQNMILLNDVTDNQLSALRINSPEVNSIGCNTCVVGNEIAEVCGSDGITYKNEDELNCGLQCNGADPSVTLTSYGSCQADPLTVVPLANCDSDCMSLPLLVSFKEACDSNCAADIMNQANIAQTKYDHLFLTNIIRLNDITDQELAALQMKGKDIASIECDACTSIDEVSQVCGTDGVTYRNEAELNCGLKCRDADKTVSVSSKGVCAQSGINELVSLTCDPDCVRMPLIIGFQGGCDNACALNTMKRANILKTDFDNLTNLNVITLYTVTDEQLMILRGESDYIAFMECDACVDSDDDSPICASDGRTFRTANELTCENKCRESGGGISIAYDGPCTDDNEDADGGGFAICFSETNQVQLSNGETKPINQLKLGDKVLTQSGYENIYSWSHYNSEKEAEFVQLLPSRVELSLNHLIFLENEISVPAGTVKAGDVLLSGEVVASVRSVKRRGAYAPFTNSGTIIVNDQVASTFVSLQKDSSVLVLNGGFSTGISHQWLAHAFEVPHRLWCSAMGCTKESYTADGISIWVAAPLQFFIWFLQLPAVLQLTLFIPIFFLFGTFIVLELILKNYFVTSVYFLSITSAFALSSGIKTRKYKKHV